MEDVWYAYKGKPYSGEMPHYYSANEFDWVKKIEQNFPKIKMEIDAYINRYNNTFEPYFNTTLVEKLKSWKTSNFIFWSKRVDGNCKHIPHTMQAMQSIPGLTTFGLSILDAHAHIKPHYGDTNAIIRCHIGLYIPQQAPVCALNVSNEVRGWDEGKVLLFCDAWEHEAWNKSDKPRYVLIFDVIHPNYIAQKRRICANVRSWLDLQKLYERKPWFKTAPVWIKIGMRQVYRLKYIFG